MKVLFLLALAAVAYAQKPTPCTAPDEWEAREFTFDRDRGYAINSKLSYDAVNQRVRRIEEYQDFLEKDFYDTLWLHNVGKEYRVNLKTKVCEVRMLQHPFIKIGIPPNATNYGETYVGAALAGQGVLVTLWGGEDPRDGGRFWGVFTSPACAPVQFGHNSNRTGIVESNFYDITLGISDPNVFIPPSECH